MSREERITALETEIADLRAAVAAPRLEAVPGVLAALAAPLLHIVVTSSPRRHRFGNLGICKSSNLGIWNCRNLAI